MEVVGEVLFPTFDEDPFNEGVAFHPDLAVDVVRVRGLRPGDRELQRPRSIGIEAVEIAEEVAPGAVTVYAVPEPAARHREPGPSAPDAAGLWPLSWCVLALAGGRRTRCVTAVPTRRRDLGIVQARRLPASASS